MEVDIRENGELWCRGRQLFSGYWGMPEATAESFDEDGWFRTGDTADRDDYGYVSLLGRTSSDIIKHKGYKISALQIESMLLRHDLIDEACVFGAPDEDAGEAIVRVLNARRERMERKDVRSKQRVGGGNTEGEGRGTRRGRGGEHAPLPVHTRTTVGERWPTLSLSLSLTHTRTCTSFALQVAVVCGGLV